MLTCGIVVSSMRRWQAGVGPQSHQEHRVQFLAQPLEHHDGFLRLEMPEESALVGYADHVALLVTNHNMECAQLRLSWAMHSQCLAGRPRVVFRPHPKPIGEDTHLMRLLVTIPPPFLVLMGFNRSV